MSKHYMDLKLSRLILPAGICFYVLCYGFYYPTFYAIQDEQIYLAKTYRLAEGDWFSPRSAGADPRIDKYPAGQALLLAPLFKLGYRCVFLLNPVLLILITLTMAAFLKRRGVPGYFSLLTLFHPAMFLFSRTIMSDIPAAFFFLVAVWLLLERQKAPFCGALALGFTISLRVAMVPFAALTLAYALWRRPARGAVLRLISGFAAGVVPFGYYLQQSLWFSAYARHDIPNILLAPIVPHGVAYLVSLNVMYPLMFAVGILQPFPGGRFLKVLSVLAVLVFPVLTTYEGRDLLVVLVFSQRLFLFTIGPLLIGYSLFLSRRLITDERRFALVVSVLALGAVALSAGHQNAVKRHYAFHREIYRHTTDGSMVITDDRSVKLIQEAFGKKRTSLNTEIIRTAAEMFAQIDAFSGGDVFLIDIAREPEDRWPQGDAILARYETREVTRYDNEWAMRIFKVSGKKE